MTPQIPAPGGQSDSPAVRISGPSGLVAAVPYLVGFVPTDSIVLVLLTPPPRTVALSLRLDRDLAAVAEDHESAVELLGEALGRAMGFGTDLDQAHVVVFGEDASSLPDAALVAGLSAMLARRGLAVGEVISTDGDRRWCYSPQHDGPCPDLGHRLERSEMLAAQAGLVGAGVGYLGSRTELEDSVRPDRSRRIRRDALTRAKAEQRASERSGDGSGWRRCHEDALWAAFGQDIDLDALQARGAGWAVSLADSRVREPLLYRILVDLSPGRRQQLLAGARAWLCGLTRIVSGSDCGPVAATLAAVAWQQGDGAFARIAALRALEAQPDNTLGELILAACSSGMPPREWIRVLETFGLHELRSPGGAELASLEQPSPWSASA